MHKGNDMDTPNWVVIFEDKDEPNVYFDDEKAARKFYEIKKGSWSCHLFQRIESSV